MNARRQLLILIALLVPFAVNADSGYQTCIACHGANGEGNPAMNAPRLAGQDAAYLQRQLNNFKTGVRGAEPADAIGQQMRAMVNTLSDEKAIAAVAGYAAQLESPILTETPVENADLRNGEVQYNSACGACHGGKAQGNAVLNSPMLAGLDRAYLNRQFDNFRNGLRGAHPEDRLGRQMAMMAATLSKTDDVRDVMAFIQAQAAK